MRRLTFSSHENLRSSCDSNKLSCEVPAFPLKEVEIEEFDDESSLSSDCAGKSSPAGDGIESEAAPLIKPSGQGHQMPSKKLKKGLGQESGFESDLSSSSYEEPSEAPRPPPGESSTCVKPAVP